MFIELTAPRGVEVDSGDEKKKGKKLLRRGNGIEFPAPPSPFHFFVFFSSSFFKLGEKKKTSSCPLPSATRVWKSKKEN